MPIKSVTSAQGDIDPERRRQGEENVRSRNNRIVYNIKIQGRALPERE
jgi:hypothetical protein